jgi:hypothetical protein
LLTTSEKPEPRTVLQETSTNTSSPIQSQGMTEKEWEIFDRLLVDLFLDNPKRRVANRAKEEEHG